MGVRRGGLVGCHTWCAGEFCGSLVVSIGG